jgi:mRNA interferase RelE/StbE
LNEHELPFTVIIEKTAQKQLQSIPRSSAIKVVDKINELRRNSLPRGCKKLSGQMSSFRIRSGDYRIIYQISFNDRVIRIRDVGHRKNVYDQLQ